VTCVIYYTKDLSILKKIIINKVYIKKMISKQSLLALKTRRHIYNFIYRNPGLHLREISRRIKIPKTTLIYHLKYLKKQDLIKEKSEGGYKRIYIKQEIGTQDKQILNLLRQEIPFKIFLYMIFSVSWSQIELSKELELHPATVSYHLKKMIEMGLIEEAPGRNGFVYPYKNPRVYMERKPVGREIFYRRKNQEIINETYRILITHKHSLSDEKLIDSYIDYLNEIQEFKRKDKRDPIAPLKIKSIDAYINSLLDFILELLKPPFAA